MQLLRGFGEQEGAPIGNAAHDAVLLKYDLASSFGDSEPCISASSPQYAWLSASRRYILFYFSEAAGPHLPLSAPLSLPHHRREVQLTTPIISYNIVTCCVVLPSRSHSFPREKWSLSENVRAPSQSPAPRASAAWHCHIARPAPPSFMTAIISPSTHLIIRTMASRSSVVRAARQLTSAAARRPTLFACQQWRQTAQMPRLFTVSTQCTHLELSNNN